MNETNLHYSFLNKLKSLPFVEAIYLYGSRARGEHQERSDIDLAIDCPAASENDWLKVLEINEEADTLLKIDCIRFDQLADSSLKEHIMRDKKIIFQRRG